jgi:hypothetical protein
MEPNSSICIPADVKWYSFKFLSVFLHQNAVLYYLSLYLLESFSSIAYAICYSCVFKSGDEIFAIISINIMSKLATRVILLVLFFATSYIIWEK